MSNDIKPQLSTEQYRLFLEASPDPIAIYDLQGNATYVNPAFEETFGWSSEELFGKRIDFVPEENRLETQQAIKQVFGPAGKVTGLDTRRFTKSGAILDIRLSAALFNDESGNQAGLIVILRDVTAHLQAEEARRKSEEKYRAILKTIEDGYYEVDLEGNFTFCNHAAEAIFGYTQKELMKLDYRSLMDEETAHVVSKIFSKVYETGAPNNGFDWRLITKDGNIKFVDTSVSLIKNASGQPIGYRGIARDITERKKAVGALRASQEKYMDLVENLPVGIYRNTPGAKGRFLEVNTTMMKMFEADSKKEFLKLNVNQLYRDPSQRKKVSEKTAKQGFLFNEEIELVTLKGKPFWASVTATKKTDELGQVYFDGIIQDITERKIAEKALQKAQVELEERVEERTTELTQANTQLQEEITERHRTEKELQKNIESQQVINKLLQISLEEISIDEQLERALDIILSPSWIATLPTGSIFLVEDDPEVLVLKAQRNLAQPLLTKCALVPFGYCLCGRAAADGKPFFSGCLDHQHDVQYEGISPHGHYNLPIHVDNKVAGVLNLYLMMVIRKAMLK